MVQIKLSVAFILAAVVVAIAPVIALPLPNSDDGSNPHVSVHSPSDANSHSSSSSHSASDAAGSGVSVAESPSSTDYRAFGKLRNWVRTQLPRKDYVKDHLKSWPSVALISEGNSPVRTPTPEGSTGSWAGRRLANWVEDQLPQAQTSSRNQRPKSWPSNALVSAGHSPVGPPTPDGSADNWAGGRVFKWVEGQLPQTSINQRPKSWPSSVLVSAGHSPVGPATPSIMSVDSEPEPNKRKPASEAPSQRGKKRFHLL